MRGAPRRAAPKRLGKAAKKRLAEAATWPESFAPSLVTEQYPWGVHRSAREKLDTWLVDGILDPFAEPNFPDVEQLAKELLERHEKRNPVSRPLANLLVARMVQKYTLPPALKRLVELQLGADSIAKRETGVPGALDRAHRYAAVYPAASLDEIAEFAGTNRDTVARWKRDGWQRSYEQ